MFAVPAYTASEATSQERCSPEYQINIALPVGTRWSMCWSVRNVEGLTLTNISYQPKGEASSEVLSSASLAEVFVPYDSGYPRYYDEGGYGFGYNTKVLSSADCPNGDLREQRGESLLCSSVVPSEYDFKVAARHTLQQGHELVLFDVAEVAYYDIVTEWRFGDDGTITARVGFTGTLSPYDFTDARTGWPIGPGQSLFAEDHTHVVIWRLDFDVDGSANNLISQFDYPGAPGLKRHQLVTRYQKETVSNFAPSRFWVISNQHVRNSDGHDVGWEVDPGASDQFRGPEGFTRHDVWVTQFHDCELVAAQSADGPCQNSLTQFVNGELLRDPVMWVESAFHHVPRDEDGNPHLGQPFDIHWQGFSIRPRDVTSGPPLK